MVPMHCPKRLLAGKEHQKRANVISKLADDEVCVGEDSCLIDAHDALSRFGRNRIDGTQLNRIGRIWLNFRRYRRGLTRLADLFHTEPKKDRRHDRKDVSTSVFHLFRARVETAEH